MSKQRSSGYMLQPRSAEITRQRAATVEVLFPAVQQPSLYARVKERLTSLWTHFFSPASSRPSEGRHSEPVKRWSPQKRASEEEVAVDPKRFKANPPANRYSCASMSQDESLEEAAKPRTDVPHFTPILTRSNLRGFTRPLREETKGPQEICPANPRLQRPVTAQRPSDQAFEASVVREEFEKSTSRLLDQVVKEAEAKQVQKSKTPTPRRDEILHPKTNLQSHVILVVQEPQLVDQRKLPEPLSEADATPVTEKADQPLPAPESVPDIKTEPEPRPESKPETQPNSEKKEAVSEPAVAAPAETSEVPASFVLPPSEFKAVQPESPGFVSSASQKSSEEPPPKAEEAETSELSPIKDLCDKPEEPKLVPLAPPVEAKPVFPGLQVNSNPFAEPPPADNPFLRPIANDRPTVFAFGQPNSCPPPVVSIPQPAFSNPFLSNPPPVAPSAWPSTTTEDAEMKAETPKALPFGGFPAVHSTLPPAPPYSQGQGNFAPTYQPFGTFQSAFGQSAPAPPPASTGNFNIGNVGARRIYRAKRPGQ